MGMAIPQWLTKFFLVVTGESWPQADEDQLRALHGVVDAFRQEMTTVAVEIKDLGSAVEATDWEGQTAAAVKDRLARLVANNGDVDQIVTSLGTLTKYVQSTAENVEYTKASIIGQLFILVIQIIALLPWLSFAPTSGVAATTR